MVGCRRTGVYSKMMSDKEFDRVRKVYSSYGRLEGTLSSIVYLIGMGLIKDVKEVQEVIETRLRKEKKKGLFGNS